MNIFTTDGIVIKVASTGESTRIVWVLTFDRGIIKAFADGAKNMKSKLHAGTSVYTYGLFSFSEKKGIFSIKEVQVKEVFFDLRNDLATLSLAQYFCEILLECVPHGKAEDEYLRLTLNSLFFLCKKSKPLLQIKSVFELRVASVSGYMPSLIACDRCGKYETDTMFFDLTKGLLYCEDCGDAMNMMREPLSVISALRFICFSEFDRIFSFELSAPMLEKLNFLTEIYIKNALQKNFRTLEYLKLAMR